MVLLVSFTNFEIQISIITLLSEREAILNEGVYSFPKSNSQVYNFAYNLHFTILDHGQSFEGSFQ